MNAALFYENKDPRTFVSLVPTSAHTGDGMGSLIALLVELTQTMLTKRLAECQELRAQVMEVIQQLFLEIYIEISPFPALFVLVKKKKKRVFEVHK